MRKVAVIGVGMTPFGISEKTNVEMFAEAAMEAIGDARIEPKEIEALFLGNAFGEFEEGQTNLASFAAAEIGVPHIPATRFEGACASATVAIRHAVMAVAGGFSDLVIAGGTEKAWSMGTPYATRVFATAMDSRYEFPAGATFPSVFGMMAHLYSKKYGVPLTRLKEQMALVAVKNHGNGFLNPKAHLRKKITLQDVLSSMMVCDPLQLYDCCPFSDGAAAVILTTAAKARKMAVKAVFVAGVGQCGAGRLSDQMDLTRVKSRELSAQQAYQQAGLTPKDIDVCELHDCFTIAEIVASEGLGFFEMGKGGEALEKGETKIGGKISINPSGGLKAKGHPVGATGAAQVYEIVKQLRGECGERQVEGAKVGLVDTLGGDLGVTCNLILRS